MWIKRIADASAPERHILCAPWAGAGPESFIPWRALLEPNISLSAVHLPGRSTRFNEPALRDVRAIVAPVVDAVRAMPSPPTVLFGHSYGAILAFEISRALERLGLGPSHMVASGSPAPSVVVHEEKIAHLPADRFMAKVGEYGGLPPELLAHQQHLEVFTSILRADFTAFETYVFEEGPLDCPIFVASGRADPLVSDQGLEAWHRMTRTYCEIRLFEGDHFFFQGQERGILDMILPRHAPER